MQISTPREALDPGGVGRAPAAASSLTLVPELPTLQLAGVCLLSSSPLDVLWTCPKASDRRPPGDRLTSSSFYSRARL